MRHVSPQLAAHLDGRLAPATTKKIAQHLRVCERCQTEYNQVKQGMEWMNSLPLIDAPAALWTSIEAALPIQQPTRRFPWPWLATAAAAMFAFAAYWLLAPAKAPTWEVTRTEDSEQRTSQIAPGEWIETNARSRATIKVGAIGSLHLKPNTRVEVLATQPGEHRVALAHGEIHASISAPPRLFFVDTASGTAIDLGCEYDLKTADDGSGLLQVTKGWVQFEWNGLESLVPAGASCQIRAHAGPGIPYFDDAPESLKQALDEGALDAILAGSRVRDTLSLWHLLSRVNAEARGRVFDRMVALTPLPPGVSREQALKLDPATLKRWREDLAWTW